LAWLIEQGLLSYDRFSRGFVRPFSAWDPLAPYFATLIIPKVQADRFGAGQLNRDLGGCHP